MTTARKRTTKSVDLPPRGSQNRDPITKAPGAHPVEVGVGTALVGAAAGLAAGTLAGPVGAVVGAVAGGVAGGYGGKALGEALDPTVRAKGRAARTTSAKRSAARTGRAKTTRRATASTRGTTTRRPARKARSGDSRRARGPQDRARVNVHEKWEVDYWCKRLGVTPAQLRQAVRKAGPMAKDVRRQLKK